MTSWREEIPPHVAAQPLSLLPGASWYRGESLIKHRNHKVEHDASSCLVLAVCPVEEDEVFSPGSVNVRFVFPGRVDGTFVTIFTINKPDQSVVMSWHEGEIAEPPQGTTTWLDLDEMLNDSDNHPRYGHGATIDDLLRDVPLARPRWRPSDPFTRGI